MHWTEIAERQVGDVTILEVRGYMTLSESESLLFRRVSELNAEEHRHVVLNLRHVSYIDSVGIGEIVRTFLHLTQRGGMLTVCDVSPRTREVLETTHLDTVIRMFESEEDAVEAARPRH
jgi:anti-sigma B factor antagonist